MPGIVAIFTKMKTAQAKHHLNRMAATLCHDSSYSSGYWADENSGFYAAWVARKHSFLEKMPVRNEDGKITLIFSGEEFPDAQTRTRLFQSGHHFDSTGPSYLPHLYEEDKTFPLSLNGRFHAVLFDENHASAAVFNDRYGMHRLYYHESKEAFYFASEAKAILAVCPELRNIDSRSLGEFIACGAVLENRSLFQDIAVLPAGSMWIFRNGILEQRRKYFDPLEWEQQGTLDLEAYYQELRATFVTNLPRYFVENGSVGMSVTGGLDTRMILASQTMPSGSLPCYTFGSMFRENHDVRVARRVAHICRQPFHAIVPGREFLEAFPSYAERTVYMTEGFVDVSRSPDLYLNEKACEIAPVRLTGNYGGEMLRGVQGFKPELPTARLYSEEVLADVRHAATTYNEIRRGHPITFAAFKQAPWYQQGVLALEETQLTMRSPYLDNDFVRTVYRSPIAAFDENTVSLRLVKDGNPALAEVPTDRGIAVQRGLGRAISHALLEFSFKAEYAYDMGMPQWLARIDHRLAPLRIQNLFLGRHKVFHFRVWYRDALADYVKQVLLDSRSLSRPYVKPRTVEVLVAGHLKGNRNYTNDLHKLLTLEILHQQFIDRVPNGAGGRMEFTSSRSDHFATA